MAALQWWQQDSTVRHSLQQQQQQQRLWLLLPANPMVSLILAPLLLQLQALRWSWPHPQCRRCLTCTHLHLQQGRLCMGALERQQQQEGHNRAA